MWKTPKKIKMIYPGSIEGETENKKHFLYMNKKTPPSWYKVGIYNKIKSRPPGPIIYQNYTQS